MAMDFFQQQDDARRTTTWLVFLFVMATIATTVAIYALFMTAWNIIEDQTPGVESARTPVADRLGNEFRGGARPSGAGDQAGAAIYEEPSIRWWNPIVFLLTLVGTVLVVGLGSLYKIAELASGGEAVALMVGGAKIDPQTRDPAERQLLNVVEEMSLASGVPVPPVFIMRHDPTINAFAAGFTTSDAVIGVTQGTLDYLTRDELQGVIAHEFSHVLNGDMRLNLRLIGVLHGLLIIALLGWFMVRVLIYSGGGRGKKDGRVLLALLLIGVGLMIIGAIGYFFGQWIKAAVSRQREYLADAAAVQFTRFPEGIAGALKKIGAINNRMRSSAPIEGSSMAEASHLFIANLSGNLSSHFLATHPPLMERIRRIDPSFDGSLPKQVRPLREEKEIEKPTPARKAAQAGAAGPFPMGPMLNPQEMVQRMGRLGMQEMVMAAAILESLPERLRDASHEPYGARAVIYALFLDPKEEVRLKQLDILKEHADPAVFEETLRLIPQTGQLEQEAKIPLVETSFPALRSLSPQQYGNFREIVDKLAHADGKIDLFEYTIHNMLLRNLDVHFERARPPKVKYHSLGAVRDPLALVVSTVARAGQSKEDEIAAAMKAANEVVADQLKTPLELAPRDRCTLKALDAALQDLAHANFQTKHAILKTVAACVLADEEVTSRENDLVRAIAGAMGCPMPPHLLETSEAATEAAAG